nr:hypothetical protein Iba_chr10cCG10080 [Ipomoea batatas]
MEVQGICSMISSESSGGGARQRPASAMPPPWNSTVVRGCGGSGCSACSLEEEDGGADGSVRRSGGLISPSPFSGEGWPWRFSTAFPSVLPLRQAEYGERRDSNSGIPPFLLSVLSYGDGGRR